MPTASSPSTSRRLLALLSLLQARRDWPASVLADRLQVSERTVRRDVDRLRELDYTIDATRGRDGGYRLGAGTNLPPLLLDDEQAVAVAIALQSADTLGAGLRDAAARALATVSRTMPARLANRIGALEVTTTAQERGPRVDPESLLHIGAATRAGVELRFDYTAPGHEDDPPAPQRRIEPHHLLLHAGRWYLLGWSPDRQDWRTLRVDRMRLSTHDGRRFTPRPLPGSDPARFLRGRLRGSTDGDAWPCTGRVVLAAAATTIAPFIGDGTVEALDDERCLVEVGSWSWGAAAAAIARFDVDIESASPSELTDAFSRLTSRFSNIRAEDPARAVRTTAAAR